MADNDDLLVNERGSASTTNANAGELTKTVSSRDDFGLGYQHSYCDDLVLCGWQEIIRVLSGCRQKNYNLA